MELDIDIRDVHMVLQAVVQENTRLRLVIAAQKRIIEEMEAADAKRK